MSRQFCFTITLASGAVQGIGFDTITSSDLPTDIAYTDVANLFTVSPQTITCDTDGHKGLVLKQHSGTQSADLLDLSDNSGTVLSQFDSGGNLGVRTTDFSEIIATGGTCRFVVGNGTSRLGYQPNFGGFLAVTDGTIKGFVAQVVAATGFTIGSTTDHLVTIKQSNTTLFQILTGGTGKCWLGSYDINSTVLATDQFTAVLSNGSTSVVNNVTCTRFDGAGGAASNGIGAGHCFRVNSSTTFAVLCAQEAGGWADKTHATRKGFWTASVYDAAGGPYEGCRIESAGSGVLKASWFAAAAVAQQTGVDAATALVNYGLLTSPLTTAAVVASADLTGQTGAVTVCTYVADNLHSVYRTGGYVTITAVTLDVIQFQVLWTDETNTARTLVVIPIGGATLSATGVFAFPDFQIRTFANTTITIQVALTTGTGSIAYDVGGTIEQVR